MDSSALDIAISALAKEISKLELSIDSLERWLWLSSAAVAVGVIFEVAFIVHEYLEDHDGWRRGIISSPSKPSLRVLLFEIASVVVVVAGIVGELWVGVVSSNRNTDLRSKNARLVSLVREKAGNAQVVAGNADVHAVSLGIDLEKERQKTARFQKEADTARIALAQELQYTGEQQQLRYVNESCVKWLAGKPKGKVQIWYTPGDLEAYGLAEELYGCLGAGTKENPGAGWGASIPEPIPSSLVLDPNLARAPLELKNGGGWGVSIVSRKSSGGFDTPLGVLRAAMQIGVTPQYATPGLSVPSLPEDLFIIVVGPKPPFIPLSVRKAFQADAAAEKNTKTTKKTKP